MRSKWRFERLVSAGGVVYRTRDGVVEVVLCGRSSPRIWALPKGMPDAGESVEEAALREVREETGLEVALVHPLDQISYWFVRPAEGVRCHKTVHFFLMRPTGGSLDHHDPEFDEVRWVPGEEALRMMTYRSEAQVVRKALDAVQQEAPR